QLLNTFREAFGRPDVIALTGWIGEHFGKGKDEDLFISAINRICDVPVQRSVVLMRELIAAAYVEKTLSSPIEINKYLGDFKEGLKYFVGTAVYYVVNPCINFIVRILTYYNIFKEGKTYRKFKQVGQKTRSFFGNDSVGSSPISLPESLSGTLSKHADIATLWQQNSCLEFFRMLNENLKSVLKQIKELYADKGRKLPDAYIYGGIFERFMTPYFKEINPAADLDVALIDRDNYTVRRFQRGWYNHKQIHIFPLPNAPQASFLIDIQALYCSDFYLLEVYAALRPEKDISSSSVDSRKKRHYGDKWIPEALSGHCIALWQEGDEKALSVLGRFLNEHRLLISDNYMRIIIRQLIQSLDSQSDNEQPDAETIEEVLDKLKAEIIGLGIYYNPARGEIEVFWKKNKDASASPVDYTRIKEKG
ncbi:MAG: hypothetical protein ABIE75_03430, partial [Candidatus Omnitrophota bacterium]